MSVSLTRDLLVQCDNCGKIHMIYADTLERAENYYERRMGGEVEYSFYGEECCDRCHSWFSYSIRGFEYPEGVFNFGDTETRGCHFVQPPMIDFEYSNFHYPVEIESTAYKYVLTAEDHLNNLIRDKNYKTELTSRQFEEVVEEVFRQNGFATQLTPQTRDGGRDIIATINIADIPVMFYIECKNWSEKIDVGIVRSLYGVQQADKISKGIIVATSSFTRDAMNFADNATNHMISLMDLDDLLGMV